LRRTFTGWMSINRQQSIDTPFGLQPLAGTHRHVHLGAVADSVTSHSSPSASCCTPRRRAILIMNL